MPDRKGHVDDGEFSASAATNDNSMTAGAKTMSTITTRDGTEIFYKDWGKGQPIVFHHGWPLSADDWDNQMMFFLAQGYRVIAHDRRGHGRSTQTDTGNEMDTYASDVAELAEALERSARSRTTLRNRRGRYWTKPVGGASKDAVQRPGRQRDDEALSLEDMFVGDQVLSFGPFELFPAQRRLLRSGEPVRLGGRAMDILAALIARPGEVVGKAELIATVWPDIFVEENNLRVHVTALRKALGDDHISARYIANVPGRGYSFVAAVTGGAATPQSPGARRVEADRQPAEPAGQHRRAR